MSAYQRYAIADEGLLRESAKAFTLLTLSNRTVEPLYFFTLAGTLPALLTPELPTSTRHASPASSPLLTCSRGVSSQGSS